MIVTKPNAPLAFVISFWLVCCLGYLVSNSNSVRAASTDGQAQLVYQEDSTPESSATPLPEFTLTPSPTVRVRPTPTPLVIPPPTNPGTRRLMVGFGVLIVVVVIIGIWINRERVFK